MLPDDFPPVSTVRGYFYALRNNGLLDEMNSKLVEAARLADGRKAPPTAGVIDSQSVKTTESGGVSGYDAGKRIKGRKRHIVTDTIGLLIGLEVHSAGIQNRPSQRGKHRLPGNARRTIGPAEQTRSERASAAVDFINQRFGTGTIRYGVNQPYPGVFERG